MESLCKLATNCVLNAVAWSGGFIFLKAYQPATSLPETKVCSDSFQFSLRWNSISYDVKVLEPNKKMWRYYNMNFRGMKFTLQIVFDACSSCVSSTAAPQVTWPSRASEKPGKPSWRDAWTMNWMVKLAGLARFVLGLSIIYIYRYSNWIPCLFNCMHVWCLFRLLRLKQMSMRDGATPKISAGWVNPIKKPLFWLTPALHLSLEELCSHGGCKPAYFTWAGVAVGLHPCPKGEFLKNRTNDSQVELALNYRQTAFQICDEWAFDWWVTACMQIIFFIADVARFCM